MNQPVQWNVPRVVMNIAKKGLVLQGPGGTCHLHHPEEQQKKTIGWVAMGSNFMAYEIDEAYGF